MFGISKLPLFKEHTIWAELDSKTSLEGPACIDWTVPSGQQIKGKICRQQATPSSCQRDATSGKHPF